MCSLEHYLIFVSRPLPLLPRNGDGDAVAGHSYFNPITGGGSVATPVGFFSDSLSPFPSASLLSLGLRRPEY